MDRHRHLYVLRGPPAQTRAEALEAVGGLAPEDVLWVEEEADLPFVTSSPSATRKLLGRSFDAVVLSLHQGVDADVIGRCHGFIWGGGALVLRLPPEGQAPPGLSRLASHPFGPHDVGTRFWARFERQLERHQAEEPGALSPVPHDVKGTEEQAQVVKELAALLVADEPRVAVLTSDRGRGKSSALGLAIATAHLPDKKVAVTSGEPGSSAEVFRFALGSPEPPEDGPIVYRAPWDLVFGEEEVDAIVVDEAAQLSVPLLQRMVGRHPKARFLFATTTRGYEGSGRGFLLRFVRWLEEGERPLRRFTLHEPIRWSEGDPLERFVFSSLILDAALPGEEELGLCDGTFDLDEVEVRRLDRDELALDEVALHDFFTLLVHAHYRTTPTDLQRILDAPNLELHAAFARGRVVAATLIAREGKLDAATCEAMARGRLRIQGQALADTLVCHADELEAGELDLIRSVRIAVHPALRRRGLATRLIEHVHASYAPDLFGTLFGATPELLTFRRAVGYELVRVGASRGSRTGEPAAVMVRPVSQRAHALMARLRQSLARNLPLQLDLLDVEGELVLDPRLDALLREGLPDAPPLDVEGLRRVMKSYLQGSRPYESAALDLRRFVEGHRHGLEGLDAFARALVEARVLEGRSWVQVTEASGASSVPSAMRGLRRAMRALAERVDPELVGGGAR